MDVAQQVPATIVATRRLGLVEWIRLALAVLIAMSVVVTVAVAVRHEGGSTSRSTPHERSLVELVNQGLIPAETLNRETSPIERLVNQGLVPKETLQP